jgi:hypothetical protein
LRRLALHASIISCMSNKESGAPSAAWAVDLNSTQGSFTWRAYQERMLHPAVHMCPHQCCSHCQWQASSLPQTRLPGGHTLHRTGCWAQTVPWEVPHLCGNSSSRSAASINLTSATLGQHSSCMR